eukprot:GHVR01156198.1.p1 GENE.GHVR01156198.1~~GHVR01156198.1.p1  ORF type:complete len:404 (-),score=98.65 GHVR01156198.1:504-1685(-)
MITPIWLLLIMLQQVHGDSTNAPFSVSHDATWKDGRVIAIADIHGDGQNTKGLLEAARVVDADGHWSGQNTIVVQLGDVCDRGADTKYLYQWFRQLKEEAKESGGMFIQLLGNHEVMNIRGQLAYVSEEDKRSYNGMSRRREAFSKNGIDGKYIRSLDTVVIINGIVFLHGSLHHTMISKKRGIKGLNEDIRNELDSVDSGGVVDSEYSPLYWHGLATDDESTACVELNTVLDQLGSIRMVLGHTPQKDGVAGIRCDGKLILADIGMSIFKDNKPSLVEFLYNGSVVQRSYDRITRTLQPTVLVAASPIEIIQKKDYVKPYSAPFLVFIILTICFVVWLLSFGLLFFYRRKILPSPLPSIEGSHILSEPCIEDTHDVSVGETCTADNRTHTTT